MILFQLDEADLCRALAHPHVMIGSDGSSLATEGELGAGKPHPRSYGTFPRVLGRYAREQRVLRSRGGPQDDRIARAAPRPARPRRDRRRRPGRPRRLRPRQVADLATYEDPHRYAAGIEHVLVNGRVVINGGDHTGALPGRILTP